MNKLFCVLGKSASGKDTILKELFELIDEQNLNIKNLISNTSRPMRESEKNGLEYNFVTLSQFDADYKNNEISEYNVYRIDNINQTWVYYTKFSDIKLNEYHMIKCINPSGFAQLKSQYDTVSIMIDCTEEIRKQRYINRGAVVDKLDERFKRDELDFQYLKTDYSITNDGSKSPRDVAKELLSIIKGEMNND